MNVLSYGDTETSPALRHEVPLAIGDAFLYLEADGRRAVLTNALEEGRIARVAPSWSACSGRPSEGTS
jgi:Xaa-Pro aminopeptidase